MVSETPQGKIPGAGHMGGETPMDYANESRSKLGSQPDTAPKPPKVPDSGAQPLAREGKPALLTNSVVRSFAWINILGKNGIINLILLRIGLIKEPLTMLYTEFSIIIGSVYLFLPTMIMTMVGVMDGIEEDTIEAAATLGAEPIRAFLKVVLPLAVPGMIVGSILVFTGTMTAYTTPQLLGGNKKTMLATLLYQRATAIGDWTSAGVVAFVMIAITFLVMRGLHALAKVLDRRGGQVA